MQSTRPDRLIVINSAASWSRAWLYTFRMEGTRLSASAGVFFLYDGASFSVILCRNKPLPSETSSEQRVPFGQKPSSLHIQGGDVYGTDLRLDKFYTGKEKRRMDFSFIYEGLLSITPQQAVMYLVGALLIYLAIKKE